MDKEQELKLKYHILSDIRECIESNIMNDTVEISLQKLDNIINKIEAQLEILQEESIEEEIQDKDITEISSTTMYADGKPRQTITRYKYKNLEAE